MINKILFATGGIAITTGAGFGVFYLTSNLSQENNEERKTVNDFLKKNNLKLLGEESSDAEKWKQKWDLLKQENNSDTISAPWTFTNWTQTKSEGASATPEAFKTECKIHSLKNIKNEQDPVYLAISKYCTKVLNQ